MIAFPKRYADAVARLRVPSGFVLLLVFLTLSRPTRESLWAGVPVALLGLALRAWAAGHLAKNEDLATRGPYALIRNPLYAGTLVTAAGLVWAARSPVLAAVFASVFLLVYLPVIQLEEQHLRKLFPSFGSYAERVPLLLPVRAPVDSLAGWRASLYWRNEEWKALLGFAIAVAFLAWRAA